MWNIKVHTSTHHIKTSHCHHFDYIRQFTLKLIPTDQCGPFKSTHIDTSTHHIKTTTPAVHINKHHTAINYTTFFISTVHFEAHTNIPDLCGTLSHTNTPHQQIPVWGQGEAYLPHLVPIPGGSSPGERGWPKRPCCCWPGGPSPSWSLSWGEMVLHSDQPPTKGAATWRSFLTGQAQCRLIPPWCGTCQYKEKSSGMRNTKFHGLKLHGPMISEYPKTQIITLIWSYISNLDIGAHNST